MRASKERAVERMMRFIGKGGAVPRAAAGEGKVLIEASDRGAIAVARENLNDALRAGLLGVRGNEIVLTSAGRMALKRAEAPDDPFRAQHQERDIAHVETPNGREVVAIDHAESPLALLWRRKARDGSQYLTTHEFNAGERLRADYSRGQIMPRSGVNWGAAGGGGRRAGDACGIADLTDAALAARLCVEKAIEAVGPELSGVLIDVCCFLKGLEKVETERSWPARSAKVVLKSALAALARHYEPSRRQGGSKAVFHWGAEGYRPSASA